MKKLFAFIFLFPLVLCAQDIKYAYNVIDSLCSPALNGRGYTYNGDKLASEFIVNELKSFKINPFGISYFQEFLLNTNVFPNEMFVTFNNLKLKAGVDYIIDSRSNSIDGTFNIVVLNEKIISNETRFNKFKSKKYSNEFIFVDTTGLNDKSFTKEYKKIVNSNSLKARGIICLSNKLTYVPARQQEKFVRIIVKNSAIPNKIKKITVKIDAKFLFRYKTRNVVGYIKGKVDTFIVLTAHLDHLGNMGKNKFFPGAHDNASGCAMVLNLAKDFSKIDSLKYGIAFIFFSGEELGLLGSKYYVDHPLFPLEKIKFLVNLDMMGSGDDGIQIVNSSIFVDEYNLMLELNKKYDLLPNVKKRGPAANSDHYFFYAKGVPAFYIYSLGDYKQYHNIYDSRENIPLSGYNQMFKLFKLFILNL